MDNDPSELPYADDPQPQLLCFINPDRECGPECMAYTPLPAEAPGLSDQQKNCVLIVSIERLGRYAGGAVSLLSSVIKQTKVAAQDRARTSVPAPPNPLGGKT